MLEIFKQDKSFLTRAKEKRSFHYLLKFSEHGAYLELCDNKLKLLTGVDYRVYSGLDREILQLLDQCKQEAFFEISWEDEGDQVYLDKHPRLLELLRQSDKLITEEGKQLSFADGIRDVVIFVDTQSVAEKLVVTSMVDGESEFKFLTPNYILVGESIQ